MGGGGAYSLLQVSLCDAGPSMLSNEFLNWVWACAHHLFSDVTIHDFLIVPKEMGLLCVHVINHKKTISLTLILELFHINCLNYYRLFQETNEIGKSVIIRHFNF